MGHSREAISSKSDIHGILSITQQLELPLATSPIGDAGRRDELTDRWTSDHYGLKTT